MLYYYLILEDLFKLKQKRETCQLAAIDTLFV
jgi:hypothetical protein